MHLHTIRFVVVGFKNHYSINRSRRMDLSNVGLPIIIVTDCFIILMHYTHTMCGSSIDGVAPSNKG